MSSSINGSLGLEVSAYSKGGKGPEGWGEAEELWGLPREDLDGKRPGERDSQHEVSCGSRSPGTWGQRHRCRHRRHRHHRRSVL